MIFEFCAKYSTIDSCFITYMGIFSNTIVMLVDEHNCGNNKGVCHQSMIFTLNQHLKPCMIECH